MPEAADPSLQSRIGTSSLMHFGHRDGPSRHRILRTSDRRKERNEMGWNNGREQRAFEERMRKQEEQMKALGASEDLIRDLCEYDKAEQGRERAYAERTVSLEAIAEMTECGDEWGMHPLLGKNNDALVTEMEIDRSAELWWFHELESPALIEAVKSLDDEQRELITLIVYNGYTQKEVAAMRGVTQQWISKLWNGVCSVIAGRVCQK